MRHENHHEMARYARFGGFIFGLEVPSFSDVLRTAVFKISATRSLRPFVSVIHLQLEDGTPKQNSHRRGLRQQDVRHC